MLLQQRGMNNSTNKSPENDHCCCRRTPRPRLRHVQHAEQQRDRWLPGGEAPGRPGRDQSGPLAQQRVRAHSLQPLHDFAALSGRSGPRQARRREAHRLQAQGLHRGRTQGRRDSQQERHAAAGDAAAIVRHLDTAQVQRRRLSRGPLQDRAHHRHAVRDVLQDEES